MVALKVFGVIIAFVFKAIFFTGHLIFAGIFHFFSFLIDLSTDIKETEILTNKEAKANSITRKNKRRHELLNDIKNCRNNLKQY